LPERGREHDVAVVRIESRDRVRGDVHGAVVGLKQRHGNRDEREHEGDQGDDGPSSPSSAWWRRRSGRERVELLDGIDIGQDADDRDGFVQAFE
jgi:hypothetical protein